ncbi:type VI secretion protein [Erwinia sp. OLTSP20]|uniref:type VI secretion system baseplate subunit TssF n=1 Tax=unclassified Erwinia TaxID=2622719 RepID=UPI000C19BB06|nr:MULTISPECIES: type VI secretion system baseplate subunit TssF [unclassified Erwinia]PIJ49607.1 type VI secretion protein [Erwinia sp. OAMSP11]PIJ71603.1 type VI secretion protein [Erwinia sp. OLSSP12]PIJ82673.1 type VI secretion protein [Erwinia sp. OLCASP19]PIJ83140.1 type VI secretion protein [Erwinia sp. OLMTSP26]PIJ85306.1 type VI secretion protein [Erwinia sp. OLMDSP33]
MNNIFLNYYNQELTFIREMAREFADKHPKIAGRLGMQGLETTDPFVERLIEAFCFLSARTQIKLDAEFPLFTQRLLDIVYPNYTAPTPSMSVIQLKPNLKEGDLTQGYCVPGNSAFFMPIIKDETTRCEFRSGKDVQLWPMEITEARLSSLPPDMPRLEKHHINANKLKGALRITLRLNGDIKFSQLEGFDKLPVYISGEERIVSHIFELIHAGHIATILRSGSGEDKNDYIIEKDALSFEGLEPGQGLLPVSWNIFHGHNLIQEYFSFRKQFYFFTLTQLADCVKKNDSSEMEVIILLDRLSQNLIGHISPACFLLYCTPVINLFSRQLDKLEINRAMNEFHVVPDRSRPLDFEIFSVSKVFGQQAETNNKIIFNPLYQTQHCDNGNFGRYFSITRKDRQVSNARKYDTRAAYSGTEVFISLVDQREAPYSGNIRYLSINALVTNRDLPMLVAASGNLELTMLDSAPVENARLVCQISPPRAPFAVRESAWRLIRQLSFNYLPLSDMTHSQGGESLRNMLKLFISDVDYDSTAQINALVGCHSEPVIRRLPGSGLLIYGRGIRCTLTVDEEGFSGVSPYLFGLIMENYIARHAAINVFTETELSSMQRGKIAYWPARPGRREVL